MNSLLGISYRELNLDLDRKVRRPYLPSILMFPNPFHDMTVSIPFHDDPGVILRIHDILPSRSWYPYSHALPALSFMISDNLSVL